MTSSTQIVKQKMRSLKNFQLHRKLDLAASPSLLKTVFQSTAFLIVNLVNLILYVTL
jgi:hypothetical protein